MNKNKSILKTILTITGLFLSMTNLQASAMVELIRGNAKFNIVIVVLSIIFLGIIIFMFRLDNKINKLEEKAKKKS